MNNPQPNHAGEEPTRAHPDTSFWSRSAVLVALDGERPPLELTEVHGRAVRRGDMATLVADVMREHPADRWRYSIVTEVDGWMTATDIEVIAFRKDFPFPDALAAGRDH
jgi:hypothetical protein